MSEDLLMRLRGLVRRAGLTRVPKPVLASVAALACVAAVWALWAFWPSRSGIVAYDISTTNGAVAAAPATTSVAAAPSAEQSVQPDVVVQVVGAVHQPGVYRLRPGSRVQDAVDAAGGLLGDAPQAGVNLARIAVDGEQIVVPSRAEWQKGGSPAGAGSGAGMAAAGTAGGGAPAGPVDINSANAEQLDALPGIGPSTAAKIVADRTANGRFASTDDLARVPGIGPKKLDALKGLVVAR